MRLAFLASSKPRERILADAFAQGARVHGDDVEIVPLGDDPAPVDCDVAIMVGVKSRERWQAYWKAGAHTIMLDKGYSRIKAAGPARGWHYWRIAVDGHHPTRYVAGMGRPADRFERLGLKVAPWRKRGKHIVIAGSSAKYHDFYGLMNPTRWTAKLVGELKEHTERRITYRPKPSWREAVPVVGTRFSGGGETIDGVLEGAHALITHGSNACFEAMLAGVPSLILGDGVARPISSHVVAAIEDLYLAEEAERMQLLANLAYCQFSLAEFASGEAWEITRPLIYGAG